MNTSKQLVIIIKSENFTLTQVKFTYVADVKSSLMGKKKGGGGGGGGGRWGEGWKRDFFFFIFFLV